MWGATHRVTNVTVATTVSIHAPMWGATSCACVRTHTQMFQSTHPCGERLTLQQIYKATGQFQSTLPCGERPRVFGIDAFGLYVSIHAPMWGATRRKLHNTFDSSFNPRSHVGSDLHSLLFSFTMSYNTIFAKEPYITINYTVILTMLCLIC